MRNDNLSILYTIDLLILVLVVMFLGAVNYVARAAGLLF